MYVMEEKNGDIRSALYNTGSHCGVWGSRVVLQEFSCYKWVVHYFYYLLLQELTLSLTF